MDNFLRATLLSGLVVLTAACGGETQKVFTPDCPNKIEGDKLYRGYQEVEMDEGKPGAVSECKLDDPITLKQDPRK